MGSLPGPGVDFLLVAVAAGVVGGGVVGEAVGDGLDEGGAAAGAGPLDGLLAGLVDGEEVVAVDLDGGHAVGEGALGDGRRRASGSFARDAEMAHWLFWQKKTQGTWRVAGEVHGFVEVALGGRAVAEVGDRDALAPCGA
jgi:hypothetical protein